MFPFTSVSFGAECECGFCRSVKTKAAQTIPLSGLCRSVKTKAAQTIPLSVKGLCQFPTVSFDVKWELCSSVETAAAQMIPPCDDSLMIRFMSYKQTLHTFGLPFESYMDREIQEVWVFPDSPTEAIMVRPSDLYSKGSVWMTPSGCMLRDFISTHYTSPTDEEIIEWIDLDQKIIKVAQRGIASGAQGFVDVRRRETIDVAHILNDEETIMRLKKKFEESKRGTCTICFEDYEIQRDDGIRLPCGHAFHGHCISEWLAINARCPVCSQTLKHPQVLAPWFNPPAQDGLLMSISSLCDEPLTIEEWSADEPDTIEERIELLQSEEGIDRGAKPRRLLKMLKSIFCCFH